MNGKIALITGGSRGLGRSTARQLAHNGVGVILTDQQQSDATEEIVTEIEGSGGTAAAIQLDVSDIRHSGNSAAAVEQTLGSTCNRQHSYRQHSLGNRATDRGIRWPEDLDRYPLDEAFYVQ